MEQATTRTTCIQGLIMLILPGDPIFDWTLATMPPPGFQRGSILVADSQTGILRPVSLPELREYIEGGEYAERMYSIGDSDDPEESSWLATQELNNDYVMGESGDN